jgi:hypothetical protein
MSKKSRDLSHLVATFHNISYVEGIRELRESHDFLVERAQAALSTVSGEIPLWGINLKRTTVTLGDSIRPKYITKCTEKLGEVINMVATLERLIAALEWYANQPGYRDLIVKECHPSTSSTRGSNDLMLAKESGDILVRCEICDVVSDVASQNGKETQDLKNLGCHQAVPIDGVDRFICTSSTFAEALSSSKRKWKDKQYRYKEIRLGGAGETVLLKLAPPPSDGT